jgi:hypothetical protein
MITANPEPPHQSDLNLTLVKITPGTNTRKQEELL